MKEQEKDAVVKITIEISPTQRKSNVKSFRKVMEFQVNEGDLPLKIQAHSARIAKQAMALAEEMCED